VNQGDSRNGLDDAELAGSASKGNERAFRQLLERHRQRILGICWRMLNDRIEAEEAAQDSFVKIYLHLGEYDPGRSFSTWAASIAINECRDRLRRRSRAARRFRELSENDAATGDTAGVAENEVGARLKLVEDAIERLPGKLKEVLVLKAYGDHSYEEMASILKIRIGTVMSRLFRARQKLTEMIGRSESV